MPLSSIAMPDLGTLSLSSSLTLSHCSTVKPPEPSSDLANNSLCTSPPKTLRDSDRDFQFPVLQPNDGGPEPEPRVLKRTRGSVDRVKKTDKGLMDRVKDPFSLPFLVGAPKMAECCFCHHFVCPGEEILCSVRGCNACYHKECAKEAVGVTSLKKFKCPQHACFICKQKLHLRCVRCTRAFHNKCAPWPDAVVNLKDHPGQAVCWRHPSDWRLDRKAADWTVVFVGQAAGGFNK